DDTSNYDGVTDKTGNKQVTITVGSKANGGNFGFTPAAVRVDPGTKIIWKWNGKGGQHNDVAQDGSFSSELVDSSGHTFSKTFENDARIKYYCEPHKSLGMKGAVVVGNPPAASGANGSNASDGSGAVGGGSGDSGGSGAADGGTGEFDLTSVPLGLFAIGGGLLVVVLSPLLLAAFIAIRGTASEGSAADFTSTTDDSATSAADSPGWVQGGGESDWYFSRRAMMAGAAGTAGGVAAGGAIGATIAYDLVDEGQSGTDSAQQSQATPTAGDVGDTGFEFFTIDQAKSVEALAERIFPADNNGPGATDAGVVFFIDRQLAGSWGVGGKHYMDGPYYPDQAMAEQGWQHPFVPQDVYEYALESLTKYAKDTYDGSIADLNPKQQDKIISALESDDIDTFGELAPSEFFTMLRQNVLERMYSDPIFGGNHNMDDWTLQQLPRTLRSLGRY